MEKALKFSVVKKDSYLAELISKVNKNCENMKTLSDKARKILSQMVKINEKLQQVMDQLIEKSYVKTIENNLTRQNL